MTEIDLDELRSALADYAQHRKENQQTAREQRIIAGFEEIERFVEEHGRLPQHGEDRDIFERLYAVRLDRIRASSECMEVLRPLDARGLLRQSQAVTEMVEEVSDEELLAALRVGGESGGDVTQIKHVRLHAERKSAEEVAQRKPCADFETFRPIFQRVQQELESGDRRTVRFQHNGKLEPGDLFILEGQKVLVAARDEAFVTDFGREDRRLRVIYDNGTESNLLLRSLQRALYKDENGRRILPPQSEALPLFAGDEASDDDTQTGVIYVLRSLSEHPFIAEHREVIHKIGVTGGEVKSRIANAKRDPTYLLADVEIVATFRLANINRKRLEALLHKFFGSARLDLGLKDRFGSQVEPREWFLVPLTVIEEAIEKIKEGTIGAYRYDAKTASLTPT